MMPPSIQLELFPADEDFVAEAESPTPSGEALDSGVKEQEAQLPEDLREAEVVEETSEPASELTLDGLDERRLTAHVCGWLEPLYLRGLGERIRVKWNSRLQTTAGRAYYKESRIELNPMLITVSGVGEIERTLKHELAHLVAYERCGKIQRRQLQPHGPEWQEACDDLGIPGEDRCHELELPGRTMRRKFAYCCPACGETIKRVKRFKSHVACYACCRQHSKGRYDKRFALVEKQLEP